MMEVEGVWEGFMALSEKAKTSQNKFKYKQAQTQ